ncbi:DUF5959 family protein [Nocardioides sp. NPDC087217]|uniref:DUF5959 family protein n=1 Tax=Nocardioides sp. NPDC087217 TaxID=3364335 RepID=UPI003814F6ED
MSERASDEAVELFRFGGPDSLNQIVLRLDAFQPRLAEGAIEISGGASGSFRTLVADLDLDAWRECLDNLDIDRGENGDRVAWRAGARAIEVHVEWDWEETVTVTVTDRMSAMVSVSMMIEGIDDRWFDDAYARLNAVYARVDQAAL